MDFTELIDLASERLGGAVLVANDDFFAPKENLLKASTPIFIPDKYTDRGKWMDGWESRRRRTPGFDWCIIRLGLPGIIIGPFLGAIAGELTVHRDWKRVGKVGLAAWIGFVIGTAVKVALAFLMIGLFAAAFVI